MEEKLKQYLTDNEFFKDSKDITVREIIDGNSSNHLNYKASSPTKSFLVRLTKPDNLTSYTNLADEFTILKLVQNYKIAPEVYKIDLEGFETPLLIEEFLSGQTLSDSKASKEIVVAVIKLLNDVSQIPIREDAFPFKSTYTTYQTNFRAWDIRTQEILQNNSGLEDIIEGLKELCQQAQAKLLPLDPLLNEAPVQFIYNDVHPGNIIWNESQAEAKFVDWQKVSLGDPAFMLSLFVRRFSHLCLDKEDFQKLVNTKYPPSLSVSNFALLLQARVFERAVSDAVWSVWSEVKRGNPQNVPSLTDNKHYREAVDLMSGM